MENVTIELSDIEYKAMEYISFSVDDWVSNVAKVRAGKAINEIVDLTVKHCLDNNLTIPNSRDEIVNFAFDNGLIQTMADNMANTTLEGN